MITQATRNLSYKQIKPKRQTRHQEILGILGINRMTASEIALIIAKRHGKMYERNLAAPRLTELEEDGKVRHMGTKKCPISGQLVAAYVRAEPPRVVQQSLF